MAMARTAAQDISKWDETCIYPTNRYLFPDQTRETRRYFCIQEDDYINS